MGAAQLQALDTQQTLLEHDLNETQFHRNVSTSIISWCQVDCIYLTIDGHANTEIKTLQQELRRGSTPRSSTMLERQVSRRPPVADKTIVEENELELGRHAQSRDSQ